MGQRRGRAVAESVSGVDRFRTRETARPRAVVGPLLPAGTLEFGGESLSPEARRSGFAKAARGGPLEGHRAVVPAGEYTVTSAVGDRFVPVGHDETTAHWNLVCRRAQVARRIGR